MGKILQNHTVQLIVILIGVSAIYWQTTGFDFVLDDKMVITENKYVQKGIAGLKDIFFKDSMSGYLGDNPNLLAGGRYRPLSLALFAIGHELFGQNRFLYHLLNILSYLLCCIITWSVMINILKGAGTYSQNKSVIWAAIALFAIHPVHTEVVANIKGLDEILSYFFAMGGFLSVLKFQDSSDKKFLIAGLLSLFLSFMSKESSLPFVIIIPLALYFFRNFPFRRALIIFLLMLLPAIAYFGFRYQALGYLFANNVKVTGLMNNPFLGATFSEKYGTIALTILLYLKLIFVPYPLTHDYYPWQIPLTNIYHPLALISIVLIIFLVYLAIRQFRKKTLLSFLILFFFITLSIVSNIVINVGTLMNERFLFIPSFAFSIFVIWGYSKLKPIKTIWPAIIMVFLFLSGFTFINLERLPDWKTMKTLDSADVVTSKNSARANMFYAVVLFNDMKEEKNTDIKSAKIKEGTVFNNRALEIYLEYDDALKMKAGFAAEKYLIDKDVKGLLKTFTEIIQITEVPYVNEFLAWLTPREEKRTMAEFFFNAGYNICVAKKKDFRKGLNYLKQGYSVDQVNKGILFGLCVVSYLTRDYQQSINYGRQYMQYFGENADILYYTGNSMMNTGQQQNGLPMTERAFQLNPELRNRK